MGAAGTVSLDEAGTPISYVVSEGDKLIDIPFRFGVDVTELTDITGKRHDYSGDVIYPGDEIKFKATRKS